mmetsp:Transcript_12788/g.14891  ORF Transcript_12788/g.14891 Transcript_12788/m.14891 type:complete len:551 (+) Transcript_12788:62-1714(+)
MSTSSNKRKRLDPWDEASKWIRTEGGFIHDSITFSSSERIIKVISSEISSGTVIMKIPSHALVTLSTVEKVSILGSRLFHLIHSIDEMKLHHSKNDILLALYLAFVSTCPKDSDRVEVEEEMEIKIKINDNDHDSRGKNKSDESYKGTKFYLATLPDYESYDNLPRRWTEERLRQYLSGTMLLERIQREKSGLKNDYDLLFHAAQKHETDNLSKLLLPFPSFDLFDQMLSAVASRAFDSLGDDNLEAMVPLLDLFNHKRGTAGTSDISYRRSDDDGSIIVTARCDLNIGSTPGITYGAKGNAQLLERYGFTLANNIEPDGSSNDIMYFEVKSNVIVQLRRGGKSYTYGSLVKVLESYINEDNDTSISNCGSEELGMEDFLNACEQENDDFNDVTGLYDSEIRVQSPDFINSSSNNDNDIDIEIQAIDAFILAIHKARDKYKYKWNKENLHKALKSENMQSSEHFSALLVYSEIQTLDFYEMSVRLIQYVLEKKKPEVPCFQAEYLSLLKEDKRYEYIDLKEKYGEVEGELVEKQVVELVNTFLQIRHGWC